MEQPPTTKLHGAGTLPSGNVDRRWRPSRRMLVVACGAALLHAGCAQSALRLRPEAAPDAGPQFHNRLSTSENNDVLGL